MIKCTEYRMGKRKTVTDKPLRQRNAPVELTMKLAKADSTQARRELVSAVNPFFYIFGKTLRPWKDYQTYNQNMEIQDGN